MLLNVWCRVYWSVLSVTDKLTSNERKNILESFYSCLHLKEFNIIFCILQPCHKELIYFHSN